MTEQGVRDGRLAAAAETVKDEDLVARSLGEGVPQPPHEFLAVTEDRGCPAHRGMPYGVGALPRGSVVMVFGDVLVARGLVDAPPVLGPPLLTARATLAAPATLAAGHPWSSRRSRPAW
ncbi:hypothetical protein [Streptomyces sp. NPDC006638]|uniref:hypothetical protein n=1 Tax=Streptomyces sp. NPDC006638 TaxID=3157183 RepID=UPI0033BA3C53